MTFNGHFKFNSLYGPIQAAKILPKNRSVCSVRFMQIFTGIFRGWGYNKWQCGGRKRRFSEFVLYFRNF